MWGSQFSLVTVKAWSARHRFLNAMQRLDLALKRFNPGQPRVPRGYREGGQWTVEGGGPWTPANGAEVQLVSRRRGGGPTVRINGRPVPISPAQQVRLAISQQQMQRALAAVRQRDPNWKPTQQAYETVEGQISANLAIEREARERLFQLEAPRAGIGPYAREWVEAPPNNVRIGRALQRDVNRLGRKYGCHQCGSKEPGTISGNFIGDHQVPRSTGPATRIYPHCKTCSSRQGGLIKKLKEVFW